MVPDLMAIGSHGYKDLMALRISWR